MVITYFTTICGEKQERTNPHMHIDTTGIFDKLLSDDGRTAQGGWPTVLKERNCMRNFTETEWKLAKEQAKAVIVNRIKAKERNAKVSYSELVSHIDAIELTARAPLLSRLLDEISREENSAGRGMLSVIVVHKTGDHMPGPGFFELAKALGRDIRDRERCWINEHSKVCSAWSETQ